MIQFDHYLQNLKISKDSSYTVIWFQHHCIILDISNKNLKNKVQLYMTCSAIQPVFTLCEQIEITLLRLTAKYVLLWVLLMSSLCIIYLFSSIFPNIMWLYPKYLNFSTSHAYFGLTHLILNFLYFLQHKVLTSIWSCIKIIVISLSDDPIFIANINSCGIHTFVSLVLLWSFFTLQISKPR